MATAWRQIEESDSEEDVVFVGPVTERELEISRMLNETICLPDPDASVSANDTLDGLEDGLRAVALEGTRESCTMHELELPCAGPGTASYPVTSSRLDESAAPLASSENTSSRQWEETRSEPPLSSTRLTEDSRVWEELPSENPLSGPAAPAETGDSRVWEEMPSECPIPDTGALAETEDSRVWEELPSENPLSNTATAAEESRVWEEMPSECPISDMGAPAETEESRVWEKMPSECPLLDTGAPAEKEESRVWEEMPSECPISDTGAPAETEESRVWQEMPSECPLPERAAGEESRVWEELPSENPLPDQGAAPAEDGSVCEDRPSVNPLPDPAGVAEESRVWEELPSECPLSAPPAEESRQWEELPSEYPLSAAGARESLCDQLSDEPEPETDNSRWLTLDSDDGDAGPGDSLDEGRKTPGEQLLGALCDELDRPTASRDSINAPSVSIVTPTPRVCVTSPSPRSPPPSGGLLQAMHRQLSSPGAVSVAASVDSYHTCYGGGMSDYDDSRRLTGVSALSGISMMPAAPPNSTVDMETGVESESEDDSRLYESSVEEQMEQQPSVTEISHASAIQAVDDTTSDNCRSPPVSARDRITSLPSESSLAGSYVSSTGSELNDTLEMMERLLAMEAEERRLESILQSRTATGDASVRDGHAEASGTELGVDVGNKTAQIGVPPAVTEAVTPSRSAVPAGKVTPMVTQVVTPVVTSAVTPRGRRPAVMTPRHQLAAKSPARLATPRGKVAPSPARSALSAGATASLLKTPTPVNRTVTVAPGSVTPRTKPNLKDIVSPVARYIHDGPEPTLIQNIRPRTRVVNSVVPQSRPTPQKLTPLAEETVPGQSETGNLLKDLDVSAVSNASNTSGASVASSASTGSRIPVKVPSRSAGGQENRKPQSSLPKVSYKSSGNLVMDKTSWNKLVRKNTAENRKVGRFVPSPAPVLAVKHTGHKSVASRRVRWNDEFSVPDTTVRVRAMRRSISDCDLTQSSEASFMEVSLCEVRSARPAVMRH